MQGLLAANAAQMQNFTVSIINNPISDVKCFVRRCLGVQKDLSLFMRICCFGALLRGLQNLEAPLKGFNCCGAKLQLQCVDSRFAKPRCSLQRGRFYVLFASCKKNQKARQRFANLWTPGTIQIAGRYVLEAKVTGFHQVTGYAENCIFPGIAGNDLNRCDVPALQRKDLERRLKEQLYSLRTVG